MLSLAIIRKWNACPSWIRLTVFHVWRALGQPELIGVFPSRINETLQNLMLKEVK
jgi:hypothetical protein